MGATAFDPQALIARPARVTHQDYTRLDTILYALGVGAGLEDPTDPAELRFLYERDLLALPTLAVVLAAPPFWFDDPALGIDWKRLLNAGQELTLARPIPVEGKVSTRLSIDAVWDKGREKGAIMDSTRILLDEAGLELARIKQTHFLRGNGGFGGPAQPKVADVLPPADRGPDHIVDLPTRPEQALIYRLTGDLNPLHIDPAVGRSAGFARPILHGACTFGIVGRAVLRAAGGNEPSRLHRLGARFSSPVYPGETIRTEIWEGVEGIGFRARVVERDVIVLDRGVAVIGPPIAAPARRA
jgi:acyl dehydratase